MTNKNPPGLYHADPKLFREALLFTESSTGFSARLIEKDYYLSLVLHDLSALFGSGLVFKGGTCLSKVYTEFYRLSEDLDFALSVPVDASAATRRKAASAHKAHIGSLPERHACFRVEEAIVGHNLSRHYTGRFSYESAVTGEADFIKVEVGLREPVVMPATSHDARALLLDPFSKEPAHPPVRVTVIALLEAYAEKFRAALTRREPAIRDFFDIHVAVGKGMLDHTGNEFLSLVRAKLAIPGNDSIDTSEEKTKALRDQLRAQLEPVLRRKDFEAFVLERAVEMVSEVARRCND
ncbi:MAG TPA: nucleotidyl transferase AbiEii/AbiGii toxin family protein [Gemmataceae bacterium]|jgi:predicted nucleotidyltransferase component of viral defense system